MKKGFSAGAYRLRRIHTFAWILGLTIASAPAHAASCTSTVGCYFDSEMDAALSWTGFTTPNAEGWNGFSGPSGLTGTMAVVNSPSYSGAGSLDMNFICTGSAAVLNGFPACVNPGGGGLSISRTHPPVTRAFGRMMLSTNGGFAGGRSSANGNDKILFHQGSTGWPIPIIGLSFGAYTYDLQGSYDHGPSAPTILRSGVAPSANPNVFDLVEWELKLNTRTCTAYGPPAVGCVANRDGYVNLWINGVQVLTNNTGRAFVGPWTTADCKADSSKCSYDPVSGNSYPTPADLKISSFKYFLQSGYGHMYVDRAAIGPNRIGCPSAFGSPGIVGTNTNNYCAGGGQTADTQAPSVPANLKAQAVSSSQINLTWNASTDNVGVTGYRIYRSSTQIGTATGTTYSSTGLSASTAYSYTVSAYDAAGNASAQSAAASTTTLAVDRVPPAKPRNLRAQ